MRLKQEVRNPTVLTLLNFSAEHAGVCVSYDEVCEKAGRTTHQAIGDLAGFTQLIKRHFNQTLISLGNIIQSQAVHSSVNAGINIAPISI